VLGRLVPAHGDATEEVFREERNVVATLAQRRQVK
jgi:hypothetical protein